MEQILIVTTDSIFACQDGTEIQFTAALQEIKIKETKISGKMAIARIDGGKGNIEALIFPDAYRASKALLTEGAIVTIQGQVDDGRPEYSFKIKVGRISRPV